MTTVSIPSTSHEAFSLMRKALAFAAVLWLIGLALRRLGR